MFVHFLKDLCPSSRVSSVRECRMNVGRRICCATLLRADISRITKFDMLSRGDQMEKVSVYMYVQ
jgi:hypothetical protein